MEYCLPRIDIVGHTHLGHVRYTIYERHSSRLVAAASQLDARCHYIVYKRKIIIKKSSYPVTNVFIHRFTPKEVKELTMNNLLWYASRSKLSARTLYRIYVCCCEIFVLALFFVQFIVLAVSARSTDMLLCFRFFLNLLQIS